MFRKLFAPDSNLMIVMTWITDCIFLSIFWMLACVPIITVGAATAALYDATYWAFRRHDKHSWTRFVKSFLRNLKSSLLPTIVFLAVLLGCGHGLIQLWNNAVLQGGWMVFAAAAVVGIVVLGILSLVFPLLSRFESGCIQLLVNTVRLSLANLPRILALAVINGIVGFACIRLVIPIVFLPAVAALLSTIFVEPILKPYLPEDFLENESEDN